MGARRPICIVIRSRHDDWRCRVGNDDLDNMKSCSIDTVMFQLGQLKAS